MSEFLSSKVLTLLYVSSTLLTAFQWLGGAARAAPAAVTAAHSNNQNSDGRVDAGSRKPQTVGSSSLIRQQQREEQQTQEQLPGLYYNYPPAYSAERLLALQNFRLPLTAAAQQQRNALVDEGETDGKTDADDDDAGVVIPQWLLRHSNDRVPLMGGADAVYAAPPLVRQSSVAALDQQLQRKRSFGYFGDRSQPLSGLIYAPARG